MADAKSKFKSIVAKQLKECFSKIKAEIDKEEAKTIKKVTLDKKKVAAYQRAAKKAMDKLAGDAKAEAKDGRDELEKQAKKRVK